MSSESERHDAAARLKAEAFNTAMELKAAAANAAHELRARQRQDPGQTPVRGLTAVLRGEIGPNSFVRLGVVCTVGLVLLGGILWLTKIQERQAILEYRNQAIEQRLEKMDCKLDKLLERP